jgi:hypothetical protein
MNTKRTKVEELEAYTYGYNIGGTHQHELLMLRDSQARLPVYKYDVILTASEETVKVLARVLNSDPAATLPVLARDKNLQESRTRLGR